MSRGMQSRVAKLEARAPGAREEKSGALILMHEDESQADAEARHYAEHPEDRDKPFVMRVRFIRFVKAQEGRPA